MAYVDLLRDSVSRNNSIVCMGMDPVHGKMPFFEMPTGRRLERFYTEMLDTVMSTLYKVAAVKPNLAFWEQYDALDALERMIRKARDAGVIVVGDAKRGDIGKTSAAYAVTLFDNFGFNAVTVAPYMGSDSVEPFFEKAAKIGGGVYVLCRTSNKGARDFEDLELKDDRRLYEAVADKTIEWAKKYPGIVGSVVGATAPDELERITRRYVASANIPKLIPGVGDQGGSATEVVGKLCAAGDELSLNLINSSGGINYAFEGMDLPPMTYSPE